MVVSESRDAAFLIIILTCNTLMLLPVGLLEQIGSDRRYILAMRFRRSHSCALSLLLSQLVTSGRSVPPLI